MRTHQSAAVRWIRWTQLVAPAHLDSGWDKQTEHPLWTAGCFCEGGRLVGRGGRWVAGWEGCTGTVYQLPAELKTTVKMDVNKFPNVFG